MRRTAQSGSVPDALSPEQPQLDVAWALVSALSTTDRAALIECLKGGGLQKREGFWHGSPGGKPISGNTVANLGRGGLLAVTKKARHGSAALTEHGERVVRTLMGSKQG